MSTSNNPVQGTFQGDYVLDIKAAVIGAFMATEHVVMIGPRGCGKTDMSLEAVERITDSHHLFIPLEASSAPEVISGMPSPAAALATPPRFEIDHTNTPFDPNVRGYVLDEIGRANDPVWDACLHALERKDIPRDLMPVCIATTNFMPTSERTDAMRDRFALWVHVNPGPIDVISTVAAMMSGIKQRLTVGNSLPTWADVQAARNAQPGPNAVQAVGNLIEVLYAEAANAGFVPNYRHIGQWQRLLFRVSYHYNGNDADFTTVHPEARKLLKWAYPTLTPDEAQKWAQVAAAGADPIAAAIDQIQMDTYRIFKQITPGTPGGTVALKLGKPLQDAEESLRKLDPNGDDPRVQEALDAITDKYAILVRGHNPFEVKKDK